MLNIAIVDNDLSLFGKGFYELIGAYHEASFTYFQNCTEFIDNKGSVYWSLLIICINEQNPSFLEVILKKTRYNILMFVIGKKIAVHTFYYLKPYRYIREEDLDFYFVDILETCINKCRESTKHLILPINGYFIKISIEEIEYVYTEGNYTIIKSAQLNKYRISLKKILNALLDNDFCCICGSTYVNLKKIQKIDLKNQRIYLIDSNVYFKYSKYHKKELVARFQKINK